MACHAQLRTGHAGILVKRVYNVSGCEADARAQMALVCNRACGLMWTLKFPLYRWMLSEEKDRRSRDAVPVAERYWLPLPTEPMSAWRGGGM